MMGKNTFSDQFSSYLQKEGILHEFSYIYTPQQNNVAEGKNLMIEEAAMAMLEEKHMPKFYWAEATGRQYTCRIGLLQMECRHTSCT